MRAAGENGSNNAYFVGNVAYVCLVCLARKGLTIVTIPIRDMRKAGVAVLIIAAFGVGVWLGQTGQAEKFIQYLPNDVSQTLQKLGQSIPRNILGGSNTVALGDTTIIYSRLSGLGQLTLSVTNM